ncbi:unnamed protein product [Callosobruchus maculatus]|nr:unnamed protein product [Callosobruchus maculatus]
MGQKFEEVKNEFPDVIFLKVDVDENVELSQEYEITNMPTYILFKRNEVVGSFTGNKVETLSKLITQKLLGQN